MSKLRMLVGVAFLALALSACGGARGGEVERGEPHSGGGPRQH